MLSLAAFVSHFIWPPIVPNNLRSKQHSEKHPYDALRTGWYPTDFPKSAIFLDSSWIPDKNQVPPHLRNNIQSGLRVLEPQNWMYMDKDNFSHELMLANTMMREDFKGRETMLITK
jgi:hypothetical protein